MAKTTAPLLSFGAQGTIAKTQVYSRWRGIAYARRHVVPANPQSTGQTSTRNVFRLVNNMWRVAPALLVAPWNLYAVGQPFLGRNAFMGQNIALLRGKTDMTDFIGSPGAKGGLPPNSITVTPGSSQLTVAFSNPSVPNGWTLDSAVAIAFEDQDPETAWAGSITAAEDATTQNSVDLTGLTPSTLYIVAAWLEWTKDTGAKAYSAGLTDTGTPTA